MVPKPPKKMSRAPYRGSTMNSCPAGPEPPNRSQHRIARTSQPPTNMHRCSSILHGMLYASRELEKRARTMSKGPVRSIRHVFRSISPRCLGAPTKFSTSDRQLPGGERERKRANEENRRHVNPQDLAELGD